MSRIKIYVLSLIGFFVMWGVFGFVAAAPRSELDLQGTLSPIVDTAAVSEETDSARIPVTSEPEPLWIEILSLYGLIGLAALSLILTLLSSANKSTAVYARQKGPSSKDTYHN